MSGTRLAPPWGSALDRRRTLSFTFNGRTLHGHPGDTLASALIANGVDVISRSYKLHRPRGVFSCGVEEPNALVDVGSGGERTPDSRATQVPLREGLVVESRNAWPSLRFDLLALTGTFAAFFPAGFYYKTFMWPDWHWFEPTIRRIAGLGYAADLPDPDHYDQVSRLVEVLVVGGGVCGLQAAIEAARAGREVLLIEAEAQLGGSQAAVVDPTGAAAGLVARLTAQARQLGVQVMTHTTAVACYDGLLVTASEMLPPGAGTAQRLWSLRAERLVLAVGSFERPVVFPDNDRPGVMLGTAVQRFGVQYGVRCGQRAVVVAAADEGYAHARALKALGIDVRAVIDTREHTGGEVDAGGIDVLRGAVVTGVAGRHRVRAVDVASLDGRRRERFDVDLVCSAGGATPNVNLFSQVGGRLRWSDDGATFVPREGPEAVACVGSCAGVFDLPAALAHAAEVGRAVAQGSPLPSAPVGGNGQVAQITRTPERLLRRQAKQFVDLQHDVTADDVDLAARENFRSVEHLKRYTTTGMATDQGKTSNINALTLMAQALGKAPGDVGTTKFRPPFRPVTLNAIAAGRQGELHRPRRLLPAQDWHVAQGAALEDFGGWMRPVAYPRAGEDIEAAGLRETRQVREHGGYFDSSPLGKLEVFGPDAGAFLDLMYLGDLSSAKVGRCRHGLVLSENGIVVDDGIVCRLADDRFLVYASSAGVERTALAFDEWRQCDFAHLDVSITAVTTQWANAVVSGPQAWALLRSLGIPEEHAPANMPPMRIREFTLAGVPVRLVRASFCGELTYEINVPWRYAASLFELLGSHGAVLGMGPYGIEALEVMRLEKGYLHVGADTDGTTLPMDVGFDPPSDKQVDFVGRRSLMRPNARDEQRLQLVGLVPTDRRSKLPVGAHVAVGEPPAKAEGFVTSSAHSPTLGHPIALALLERGRQRLGETLRLFHLGGWYEATVVATPFYDPQGERLHVAG